MSIFGYAPAHVRKALVGGLVAAAPLLFPDLADGALSAAEIGGLVAAFLSGSGLVFGVPNRLRLPAAGADLPTAPPAGSPGAY